MALSTPRARKIYYRIEREDLVVAEIFDGNGTKIYYRIERIPSFSSTRLMFSRKICYRIERRL